MLTQCSYCEVTIQKILALTTCCASELCGECIQKVSLSHLCFQCGEKSSIYEGEQLDRFYGYDGGGIQSFNYLKCQSDAELVGCRECKQSKLCQECYNQIHSVGAFKFHSYHTLPILGIIDNEIESYVYWDEQTMEYGQLLQKQEDQVENMRAMCKEQLSNVEEKFSHINECLTSLKLKYQQKVNSHLSQYEKKFSQKISTLRKVHRKTQLCRQICLNEEHQNFGQLLTALKQDHIQLESIEYSPLVINTDFDGVIQSIKMVEKSLSDHSFFSQSSLNQSPLIASRFEFSSKNNPRTNEKDKIAPCKSTNSKLNKNLFGGKSQLWTNLAQKLFTEKDISPFKQNNKNLNHSQIISKEKENQESSKRSSRKVSQVPNRKQILDDDKVSLISYIRGETPLNKSVKPQQKRSTSKSLNDLVGPNPKGVQQRRFFDKIYSHSNCLQIGWLNSFNQNYDIMYRLECGIGHKVNGIEQFNLVYEGVEPMATIYNLQPKTTYRLRLQTIKTNMKQRDSYKWNISIQRQSSPDFNSVQLVNDTTNPLDESSDTDVSEIIQVQTQTVQSIPEEQNCQQFQILKKGNQQTLIFDKPGYVIAKMPYYFGVVCWDLKVILSSHSLSEDLNSCILIGVTQRNNRNMKLIGCTINYGLSRESFKVRVVLDFNKNSLTITTPLQPQGEVFNNLPVGPLYPAFFNKSNHKNSLSGLRLLMNFEQ